MVEEMVPTGDITELRAWARQQQRLTTSISEFAAAFTSIRDNAAALHQLVARTRSLLDVDMAYLSLNGTDGSGFTKIVETDGVWTEGYRNLRMPLGAGVLGRVAQAGGPVQTVDYRVDESLMHVGSVDAIVEEEGVRAILGAPMRSGGVVIGALMVANRFPHEFDANQIFIAETLANLAAVAVENIRQVEELTSSAAVFRSRSVDAERALEVERRLVRADEALMEAIVDQGGLGDLRDGMKRALAREVHLVDLTVRHDLRSSTSNAGDAERPLIMLSARTDSPMSNTREDGSSFVVMAAMRDDEPIGAVVLEGELASGEELVLRRCARVLGTYLRAHDRERGDIIRRHRELVEVVLAPSPSGLGVSVLNQLEQLGLVAGEPFRILIADGSETSISDFEHRLQLDFGVSLLRGTIAKQLVALVPEEGFIRIQESLNVRGARRWGGLLVGHSPTLHSFAIAPEEYALVLRVLDAARQSDHPGTLVSLATYGAVGAFLSRVTIEPTKRAIEATLGPLLAYDREHGTALVETAAAFLDAGHSVTRAAKTLHIHDNTVRQRLERIGLMLGADWPYGQRGLDFHIMLAVNRLVGDRGRL